MFGLGKSRTRFGKWIDANDISQRELESMTRLGKNTITMICNDKDYNPQDRTKISIVGALRKEGYDVRISDFW